MPALCECPICFHAIDKPVLVTCCGHSFCRACLDASLAIVAACPLCSASLSRRRGTYTVVRNRTLEELLRVMSGRHVGAEDEYEETTDEEDDDDDGDDDDDDDDGSDLHEDDVIAVPSDSDSDSGSEQDAANGVGYATRDLFSSEEEYDSDVNSVESSEGGMRSLRLTWLDVWEHLVSLRGVGRSPIPTRARGLSSCTICSQRHSNRYWPYPHCNH